MTYPTLHLNYLGQDTEFFLWDTKKEKVVPSYKFFGMKGEEPEWGPYERDEIQSWEEALRPTPFWNTDLLINSSLPFTFYRDGLAVEVNSSPVSCRAWLWQDVKAALAVASLRFSKHPEIKFTSRPWVKVSPQQIKHFPPDLRVLGCSPTIDAYKDAPK